MSLDWADGCEAREARWSEPVVPPPVLSTVRGRPCIRCGGSTQRGALRFDGVLGPWEPICFDCAEEVQRSLAL